MARGATAELVVNSFSKQRLVRLISLSAGQLKFRDRGDRNQLSVAFLYPILVKRGFRKETAILTLIATESWKRFVKENTQRGFLSTVQGDHAGC